MDAGISTGPRESDAHLVERVRGGSVDALGLLYERHADRIYRAAFRILLAESEAEDVLHDVFVGLPDALVRYTERGSFAAWLRAVAVRTALEAGVVRAASAPSLHPHVADLRSGRAARP